MKTNEQIYSNEDFLNGKITIDGKRRFRNFNGVSKDVLDLHKKGVGPASIAVRLGVSHAIVCKHLKLAKEEGYWSDFVYDSGGDNGAGLQVVRRERDFPRRPKHTYGSNNTYRG